MSADEDKKPLHEAIMDIVGTSYEEEFGIEDEIKQSRLKAARILEERYADKGLKFTKPFFSHIPTQAFGYIGDERFYFRYRGDVARLRVGVFNLAKEQDRLEADRVSHQKRYERNKDSADDLTRFIARRPFSRILVTGQEDDFYPTVITQELVVRDALGEPYNGSLSETDEIVKVFDALLNKMK